MEENRKTKNTQNTEYQSAGTYRWRIKRNKSEITLALADGMNDGE